MSARNAIYRDNVAKQTVAVTNDAATTGEINFLGMAGGEIFVPSGSSLTSLTFHGAPELGGTFLPLQNSPDLAASPAAAIAVALAVGAGKAYPIPAECFGCAALKMVGNTSGNVDVFLKG